MYYCKNGIVSSGFTHSIHLKNLLTLLFASLAVKYDFNVSKINAWSLYTVLTLAQIFVRTVFYFPVSTKSIYRKYSLLKLLHSRTVAHLRRIVMDYFTMMTLTVMMGSMMSQRLSLGGSEVGLVLYYTTCLHCIFIFYYFYYLNVYIMTYLCINSHVLITRSYIGRIFTWTTLVNIVTQLFVASVLQYKF